MPILTAEELVQNLPRPFRGKITRSIAKGVMHLLSVDKVNAMYDRVADKKGPDFTKALLEDQNIRYRIGNADRLDQLPDGPFITISNHPYGHLDGIILVDIFGHLRPDFKVMVNALISRIRAMGQNFITVVPIGKKRTEAKAESISGVRETMQHLQDGGCVGFFPSGAVSDLSLKEKCVRDREWTEAAIKQIRHAKVPIVPVRFFDGNSKFYYRLGAFLGPAIRLLRLPTEATNKKNTEPRVGIGEIISVERQKECTSLEEFGRMLRESVYGMSLPENWSYPKENR